jgi:GAF domain-containing protein
MCPAEMEAPVPSPDSSTSSISSAEYDAGDADIVQRRLLQSIVEVACRVFGAAAASVFLIDRNSGDLVFEAVSGEGEGRLVGKHFPSGTGIAGWVAMFGQPLLVDEVTESEQFARDAAESTGYVPRSIMAAPLIKDGECIGVVEVLDRGSRPRGDLGDVDLLGMLATETAIALEMLIQLRWGNGADAGPRSALSGGDLALLQRVAERLPGAGPAAQTVRTLLATADELLASEGVGAASQHG